MNFQLFFGDCLTELTKVLNSSVQLIITSPPYADARRKTYGSISIDQYVEWFLPRSIEFKRVLKPTGTFILNIKERVVKGERSTYVHDLIRELRAIGWLWTEEWIWHKQTSYPGKWPNRFRDAWEHLYQFNIERHFDMYQDEVKIPIGDWAKPRLQNLSEKDKVRTNSITGSGFGKNLSNWINKELVYPTNVLHLATECGNKEHPAAFPISIPEFFIKLFTQKNEIVLDPFSGSGTTGVAALRLGRKYLGIDSVESYIEASRKRLESQLPIVRFMDLKE